MLKKLINFIYRPDQPNYLYKSHDVYGLKISLDSKTNNIIVGPGAIEYFINKNSKYYPQSLWYQNSIDLNLGKVGNIPEYSSIYIITRVYYHRRIVRTVRTRTHNIDTELIERKDKYYYDVLLASISVIGEIKNRISLLTDYIADERKPMSERMSIEFLKMNRNKEIN